MQLDKNELIEIGKLIEASQNILIISHKNPDGDTIGAALGLYQAFKTMGKKVTWFCVDEPAPEFKFLPNIHMVTHKVPDLNQIDATFIVDAGATHLTGLDKSYPQLFDKSLNVVNIDHHVSNNYYGKYNLVPIVAATTQVVYQMLTDLAISIDRHTATCLLTGIYTDTGSFMHSNTNAQVMRIAAKLLAKGADLRNLSKDVFNTNPISQLRLWGRVLKNIYQTKDNVTMSVVTNRDFDETGADYSQMTGVVDYVNSIPDAKYSVILTERNDPQKGSVVKGSLRTLKDDVDVAKVAGNFGGGGHVKAAGFTLEGKLEKEVRWKVVN